MKPGFGNIETVSRSGGSFYWTPGTPTNLLAVSIDGGTRITWEYNYGNKDGFEIWISIDGGGYEVLAFTEANITTYDDLVSTGILTYKVRAFKNYSYSEFSDERSIIFITPPSDLTSQFVVDTILGQLDWTDNSEGLSQYEIWSSTNGESATLLFTTDAGVTTYNDTTCKQNASVVYSIRAKQSSSYSVFVVATTLRTPICCKTDQSTLTQVKFQTFYIVVGKTVTINWGDNTTTEVSVTSTNITKDYNTTGQYNIWLTGDTNYITGWQFNNQIKIYGDITNWILPSNISNINLYNDKFTGDISNWVMPATVTVFGVDATYITGHLPNITPHATNGLTYYCESGKFSGSNITTFRKKMTLFYIYSQAVTFSTVEVDKVLKASADWYQINSPTANCTFRMDGSHMGIPTGGNSNEDKLRLEDYYTTAGFTATVTVRTS